MASIYKFKAPVGEPDHATPISKASSFELDLHLIFVEQIHLAAKNMLSLAPLLLADLLEDHPYIAHQVKSIQEAAQSEASALLVTLDRQLKTIINAPDDYEFSDDLGERANTIRGTPVEAENRRSRTLIRVTIKDRIESALARDFHEFHARCVLVSEESGGPVHHDLPSTESFMDVVISMAMRLGTPDNAAVSAGSKNGFDIRLVLLQKAEPLFIIAMSNAFSAARKLLTERSIPLYSKEAVAIASNKKGPSEEEVNFSEIAKLSVKGSINRASVLESLNEKARDQPYESIFERARRKLIAEGFQVPSYSIPQPMRVNVDNDQKEPPKKSILKPMEWSVSQDQILQGSSYLIHYIPEVLTVDEETLKEIVTQRIGISDHLFTSYKDDASIPSDVKELVDAARPHFERIALRSPSALINPGHPLRVLIEELTIFYNAPWLSSLFDGGLMGIFMLLQNHVPQEGVVNTSLFPAGMEHLAVQNINLQFKKRPELMFALARFHASNALASFSSENREFFKYRMSEVGGRLLLKCGGVHSPQWGQFLSVAKQIGSQSLEGQPPEMSSGDLRGLMRSAGMDDDRSELLIHEWESGDIHFERVEISPDEAVREWFRPGSWIINPGGQLYCVFSNLNKVRKVQLQKAMRNRALIEIDFDEIVPKIISGEIIPLTSSELVLSLILSAKNAESHVQVQ